MTDKIIIDGVDVARCCCYKNGKCLWTKRYYESDVVPDCEKIKDCYYKQLKRLEQQNKQMKSALEEIREIVKQANKDICDNCGWHNTDGCSPNGYLCHDLIEIKNKINEVLN